MRLLRFLLLICFVSLIQSCTQSNAGETNSSILTASIPDKDVMPSNNKYSWQSTYDVKNAIVNRISVPKGFKRVEAKEGSFGDWLRYLPLKPGNPDVHLYNGN